MGLVETSTDHKDPDREWARLSQEGRELMANFFAITDGQLLGMRIGASWSGPIGSIRRGGRVIE